MKNVFLGMLLVTAGVTAVGCSAQTSDEGSSTDQAFSIGGSTQDVSCASNEYRYSSCAVNTFGGRIVSARVVRQQSSQSCDQGRSWGFGDDFVWVDSGCRAEFEVQIQRSNPGPSGCGTLASGGVLYQNQHVDSCDGRTMLVHVADGQVVLFHDGNALWWSGVHDSTSNALTLQNDGNLVETNRAGRAIWSTNTSGEWGATLSVQNDCNVVLYANGRAVWSTNSYGCQVSGH